MKRIYKYAVIHLFDAVPSLELPEGYRILTCQTQRGVAYLWVEVDTSAPKVTVPIEVVGTGDAVPENMNYVSTFQLAEGEYVFHLYVGA